MNRMLPRAITPWNAPRIAVVEMAGQIGVQIRGPETVRMLKALGDDARIRAAVVEIDSPGGSAPVSDAIFAAIRRLAARKPVIAYVMSGALSGGYLVACGASKIVALPTSLVGSIGVIFMRPVVRELMERVGVKMVVTHKGDLKGMFQPWQEPSPEEQQKVDALTGEYYRWFVESVATARGLDAKTVEGYATGEMFTGKQGKEYGLVDELGDIDLALDMACEMGRVTRRLQYVRARRPLIERILARSSAGLAQAVLAEFETRLAPRIEFR